MGRKSKRERRMAKMVAFTFNVPDDEAARNTYTSTQSPAGKFEGESREAADIRNGAYWLGASLKPPAGVQPNFVIARDVDGPEKPKGKRVDKAQPDVVQEAYQRGKRSLSQDKEAVRIKREQQVLASFSANFKAQFGIGRAPQRAMGTAMYSPRADMIITPSNWGVCSCGSEVRDGICPGCGKKWGSPKRAEEVYEEMSAAPLVADVTTDYLVPFDLYGLSVQPGPPPPLPKKKPKIPSSLEASQVQRKLLY